MGEKKGRLPPEPSRRIIDALGGTFVVAGIFGLTASAVSIWKRDGIPHPRLMYLREKYKRLPVMKEEAVREQR